MKNFRTFKNKFSYLIFNQLFIIKIILQFRSEINNTVYETSVADTMTHTTPIATKALAVDSETSPFRLFELERRVPKADDVLVRIHYCGICHSDIHQAKNEWHFAKYPMVPGHEITGVVEQVGSNVKKFHVGDSVGVGCMVDSCRNCDQCKDILFYLHYQSFE